MDPTLNIKNESSGDVVISPATGQGDVTIGAGQSEMLEQVHLSDESFAEALAEGKVRFVESVQVTPEQRKLALKVIPPLLRQLGGDFIILDHASREAGGQLDDKRESYNERWSGVETLLKKGESSADGSDFLLRAVNHYVHAKPELQVVTDLEQEIADLEAEDLSVTGRTLAEWYADRDAKQEQLEQAQTDLARAQDLWVDSLADLKQGLEEAVDNFKNTDPATDIGQPVPDFP